MQRLTNKGLEQKLACPINRSQPPQYYKRDFFKNSTQNILIEWVWEQRVQYPGMHAELQQKKGSTTPTKLTKNTVKIDVLAKHIVNQHVQQVLAPDPTKHPTLVLIQVNTPYIRNVCQDMSQQSMCE